MRPTSVSVLPRSSSLLKRSRSMLSPNDMLVAPMKTILVLLVMGVSRLLARHVAAPVAAAWISSASALSEAIVRVSSS